MKIGTAIIISLLAVMALVAEIILYFFLGMGAALSGAQSAVGGLAFVFIGLMIVTASTAVLAPIGAVVELAVKKTNVGIWILLSGLAVIGVGYVGLTSVGYLLRNEPPPRSTTSGTASTSQTVAPSGTRASASVPAPLIELKLLRKTLTKQDYQDFVFFDVEYRATGLAKATRAIKGVLQLQDLFGETKMRLNWTIDKPLAPGQVLVEKGTGFRYNMFMSDHQWVNSTDVANMKGLFVATNIIYQDGSTEEVKLP